LENDRRYLMVSEASWSIGTTVVAEQHDYQRPYWTVGSGFEQGISPIHLDNAFLLY
jgi:hypothetical protein